MKRNPPPAQPRQVKPRSWRTAGAKLAMLTPFPGALGVLEVAQRTLFGWLGYGPETAIALLVYMRARDFTFALAGLAAAAIGLRRSQRALREK